MPLTKTELVVTSFDNCGGTYVNSHMYIRVHRTSHLRLVDFQSKNFQIGQNKFYCRYSLHLIVVIRQTM